MVKTYYLDRANRLYLNKIMANKYKCGICCEKVKTFGCEAYDCEMCPKWIHAKCAFPNATIDDLKILYKYNSGFVIKCIFCKKPKAQLLN